MYINIKMRKFRYSKEALLDLFFKYPSISQISLITGSNQRTIKEYAEHYGIADKMPVCKVRTKSCDRSIYTREYMVDLLKKCTCLYQAVRKTGLNPSTIRRLTDEYSIAELLHVRNYPTNRGKLKHSKEELLDLFSKYANCRQITAATGTSYPTIIRLAEEYGITDKIPKAYSSSTCMKCKRRYSKEQVELVLRENYGKSFNEIVRISGISGKTLMRYIKQHHLEDCLAPVKQRIEEGVKKGASRCVEHWKEMIENPTGEYKEEIENKARYVLDAYPELKDQFDWTKNFTNHTPGKFKVKCKVCGKVSMLTSTQILANKMKNSSGCKSCSSPFNREEVHTKSKQTIYERYGKEGSANFNYNVISKVNLQWKERLESATGKVWELEFPLGSRSYDLRCGNVLVEINPSVSHNADIPFNEFVGKESDRKPLDKSYHYDKWKAAKEAGYELISYFEWFDVDKLVSFISNKVADTATILYARKLKVLEVPKRDAIDFVDANHVMGWDRGTHNYGLYDGDVFVSMMSFGKPRFNKHIEWEMLRYCSVPGVRVVGGASRIFKHFLKEVGAKSVVTYSNNNLGLGNIYESLGFESSPEREACVWQNLRTGHVVRHNSLIMQGADRLLGSILGDEYFPVGLDYDKFIERGGLEEYSEEYEKHKEKNPKWWPGNLDIIRHYGYVRIYDCGSTKWTWVKKDEEG